jgi:GLPGLI family protein
MKKIALLFLMLCQSMLFAQSNFVGVIEYEATIRINREGTSAEANPNMPDVFNFMQKLHVNGNNGKVETVINFGGQRTNTTNTQQTNRMRRFIPEIFWDFAGKKTATVMSLPRDSVNMDKYMIEKDLKASTDLKEEKKTKKILGYNCKKATLKTADDTFTIWYTTELGFTFSPMGQNAMMRMGRGGANAPNIPSILIDGVVILAVEGTDVGFEAKKIDKIDVPLDTVKIPTDAQKVTQEEFQEIAKQRRGAMRSMGNGGRN